MAGIGNDLILEARRRAGLTQRELAAAAGTTQSAIARLETGRSTPTFDSVLNLVRLCGFDLEVFLVPRDDSDWAQARRLQPLTPSQRVERAARVAAELRRLRAEGNPHAGVA